MKKNLIIIFCFLFIVIVGLIVFINSNNISFKKGIGLSADKISAIDIRDGNTGILLTTKDSKEIEKLMSSLSNQKFHRSWFPQGTGWTYFIDIYPKDDKGYIRYTFDSGFTKMAGYSGKSIVGNFIANDEKKLKNILASFYNDLKAQNNK